ncbi:hypothetical protein Y1Q_0000036 [Alligator mississippiensis]|uniref:Uncharacterized protein n=1 Tax=Alligator mississippiensis TaxID=8496 RepID=A0A151NTT5_ALLMI|nr:hypothetical protein Y1Q_0000036 [Alligator mississippiensis]
MQLGKPMQQKPVTTSCGLTRWMNRVARTFWMSKHLLNGLSGHGHAHDKLIGDIAETVGVASFKMAMATYFSRVRGIQNDPLPPVTAGGMVPELTLNRLEVVPKHLSIHGILGDLVLIGHMEVSDPGQKAWWCSVQ